MVSEFIPRVKDRGRGYAESNCGIYIHVTYQEKGVSIVLEDTNFAVFQ